jgi:hypothetical protein
MVSNKLYSEELKSIILKVLKVSYNACFRVSEDSKNKLLRR